MDYKMIVNFIIGDKVWSPIYGSGIVREVDDSFHFGTHVKVEFQSEKYTSDRRVVNFMEDGRLNRGDVYPALYTSKEVGLKEIERRVK